MCLCKEDVCMYVCVFECACFLFCADCEVYVFIWVCVCVSD